MGRSELLALRFRKTGIHMHYVRWWGKNQRGEPYFRWVDTQRANRRCGTEDCFKMKLKSIKVA